MISRYTTRQGLTWIDLESPTREEVLSLTEEYGLHPMISHELHSRSERIKVDLYENAVYLILHFPLRNRSTGHIQETEIDFVLLKNALITTHYELVDPLHDFAKMFEVDTYLSNVQPDQHAGFLFFSQIRELYKHTIYLLEGVESEIQEIEKKLFDGDEDGMVNRLSKINRTLIDVRSSLRSHKEILKSFGEACTRMYGDSFNGYMNSIEGEFSHIGQMIEENRQMIDDFRRTNDSLLSSKTNTVMRQLTVVNVVMLPLGLISWIFAMHSKYLSLDEPVQLITVLGGMLIICFSSVLYFRKKKWL